MPFMWCYLALVNVSMAQTQNCSVRLQVPDNLSSLEGVCPISYIYSILFTKKISYICPIFR